MTRLDAGAIGSSAVRLIDVKPSGADVDIDRRPAFMLVSAASTAKVVIVEDEHGNQATFNIAVGTTMLPIAPAKIINSGTTADVVVACYRV